MKRIFTAFMMMLCAACAASAANYLTFTAEEDSSSFGIVNETNNPDVQYSIDGGTSWIALSGGKMVTLAHKGDKVLLKGDNPYGFSKSRSQYSSFKMTGKVAASGSVMSLIDGVGLSTEIPNGYCFCRLFRNCTSLTQAPELPATSLTIYCYDAMFLGCTNLKQVPTLPATTLANFCYDGMFAGCTSLTQTPELPVTTLASGCYYSMFSDCKSLTQAPALPATTLADSCYMYMFSGCTGLSEIHVSFDDWLDGNNSTAYWVRNVAPTGTFICPKDLPLGYGVDRIPTGWTVKYIDDTVAVDDTVVVEANYLTFTAEEDGSSFGIVNNGGNNPDVQYSLDGGETWTALAAGDTITLAHKGDKALLRGYNPEGFSKRYDKYSSFTMTGKIAASGSVMSLIDNTGETLVVPAAACFCVLFSGCASLTQAPELLATTLTESCYRTMFYGCTSLTQAPELPATTLAGDCYNSMFRCCTSLTQAPALPATTLADGCYWEMFSGCTSLTQAPELPATTLADFCYGDMFYGCTSLTQAPELPATTLAYGCYSCMFRGCTSLTEAPELPAMTLEGLCYDRMFSDCTSLTQAPELPAPELIAHSNAKMACYWEMFSGCTNLSEIRVAFVEWRDSTDQNDNTSGWVKNVAPTGTFICPKDLPLEYGDSRIPEGWTVQYVEDLNYLTFTAEEDGSTFGIINEGGNNPDVQYSLDGGKTWTALAAGDTITLAHKGDKALLRGDNPEGFSKSRDQYSTFRMTGKVSASGSVMSLIDGTGLSTEIPNGYCFCRSFRACTSLTRAPELPATTLTAFCYDAMFLGCTSLTQVPALPATTLANFCYDGMFAGCTSLTQTPELPVTTLTSGCYYSMFSDCTGLTQAPALPATTLADSCYMYMFSGCTGLSEIHVSFDNWRNAGYSTAYWVRNVAPTGTFICPENLPLECGANRIPLGWRVKKVIDGDTVDVPINYNFLTFTAEEDSSTFEIVNERKNNPDVLYSLDGGETWTALAGGDTVVLAHKGDKALLRGNNPYGFSKSRSQYSTFKMTGKVAASGSVMSLIDGIGLSTEIPNGYCFCRLFRNCTSLTQAPELPATSLTIYCYDAMFLGCTNLKQVPTLPATTLANFCYDGMFAGCTSLTQTPELPVTTLASGCYYSMFSDCTGLTQAPALPATTLADSCYMYMFSGCTGLTQTPELPATTLANSCYSNMFRNCTGLTQAPALPVTSLAESCYYGMFSGCTSLTQAPALPATTLANNCYSKMFSGCASLTQVPELPATTLANYCYSDMFSGCVGLTRTPELPATTLAGGCYSNMFSGCVGLTRSPQLPATTLAGDCYKGMFSGCTNLSEINVSFDNWLDGNNSTAYWAQNVAPTGTFICPETLTPGYGKSRIPIGWTVKNIVNGDTVDVPINYNFLTFTAEEDSSTFEIVNKRKNNPDVLYSLDGGVTWTALTQGNTVVLAHKGDKALLRGDNPQGFSKDHSQYSTFKMTGKVAASGSVMSLIDGIGFSPEIPRYCFYRLFKDCTSLTQSPELPAMTLADNCYMYMFEGCTSLTKAPELPATKLFYDCYDGMFESCTSLTQAPELPATDLAQGCYMYMFSGCTGLTQAPALPATTLSEWCYGYMFSGCTSLTQAPELPATKLLYSCYNDMFLGCTRLSEIHVSFDVWTTIHAEGPETTTDWVKDVAPTGTFICPKALALEYGTHRIPEGWTVKYAEEGSGVSSALSDNITVWTDELTIFVCGAEGKVSLYDMSGRIVAVSNSKDEERALSVPAKGVYVVRTNGGSSVVLVR